MGGSVGAGIGNGISEIDGGDGMLTSGVETLSPIVGSGGGVGSGIAIGRSDSDGGDGIVTSGDETESHIVGMGGTDGSANSNGSSENEGNEQALKSQLSPKCFRRRRAPQDPTRRA